METVNGLVPIVPIDDEPKLADSGKTYMIYGYVENEAGKLQQIKRGSFSLRVMAATASELGHILNTISLAFESSDQATEAVNEWSSGYADQALVGISFTHVIVTYIEGGEPAETEGGPIEGVANIYYEYKNHLPAPVPEGISGLWN